MINQKQLSETTNIFLVVTGACFISFSAVWVKTAHVSPTVSAFYRVFFGFLFLLLATTIKCEFRRLQKTESVLVVLCGLLFSLDLFCWHRSITLIGPGLATIIANFQVFILTGVGYFFFGETVRAKFLLSLPLAFLGLHLIIGMALPEIDGKTWLGILLGLATALLYSGFLITLRRIGSGNDTAYFFSLMLVSLSSSFFLGLYILMTKETFTIPDSQSWLSLTALGLFSQTIGWILISYALPRIRTSYTGLLLLLQPTLAFLWDVLFFKRRTELINWLGVMLVLIAIYLALGSSQKKS